jgi:vanadium nitrogenase delta subunit
MDTEKIDAIYNYIQERCLWQFFSRNWDREENINNILKTAADLLTGKEVVLETPMQRLFYADAKALVADIRRLFPWIEELGAAQVRETLNGVKDRLMEIAITKSLNQELTHSLY